MKKVSQTTEKSRASGIVNKKKIFIDYLPIIIYEQTSVIFISAI